MEACWAHNPEVCGSKPLSVKVLLYFAHLSCNEKRELKSLRSLIFSPLVKRNIEICILHVLEVQVHVSGIYNISIFVLILFIFEYNLYCLYLKMSLLRFSCF